MSPAQDMLLPTRKVRERYGSVSHMWVYRRLADDATFPRPRVIAKRRFWSLNELIKWERTLAVRPHSRLGMDA
jgi:hypothetical protein